MTSADIIIIGSGIAGLYAAFKIKQNEPNKSILILEKYKKQWIGGRASNDTFYGTEVVTGAGIGRKHKDKLLLELLNDVGFKSPVEFTINPDKSHLSNQTDIKKTMALLKRKFDKNATHSQTFKQYAKGVLGTKEYQNFITAAGYTDYENEDAYETLYYYGMEDNTCCWQAFRVEWKNLIMKLYHLIGEKNFKFSKKVIQIDRDEPSILSVVVEDGSKYTCNKLIIATTIDATRKLLPHYPIYKDIEGQPFLRLYAKFTKKSADILREHINRFTFVEGPLQRIIPMDVDKGVYMIAYNDNDNATTLKHHLENNEQNRRLYEMLLEDSLGIPRDTLKIIGIKAYYWPIGTHYYKPLNNQLYASRKEFMKKAQHPEKDILVIGEAVSRNQGWTEGALESVETIFVSNDIVL
jgi:hypothetical protein